MKRRMAARFVRTSKVDSYEGRKGRKPRPGPRRKVWPWRPLPPHRTWKGGFYYRLWRAEEFREAFA